MFYDYIQNTCTTKMFSYCSTIPFVAEYNAVLNSHPEFEFPTPGVWSPVIIPYFLDIEIGKIPEACPGNVLIGTYCKIS